MIQDLENNKEIRLSESIEPNYSQLLAVLEVNGKIKKISRGLYQLEEC